MKYCTKCGTQVPDDSKFCTKCGNKLNGEPAESPSKSKKPMLAGVGAVLVVAVVALVIVLSKGKGSGNPDIAASSSNVSTEKESGGTEKSGGFFDIGSDKKWEKEYTERLDAYLKYYEEHEKDADTVYGWVLLNEDNLPYMVLENEKRTENYNGEEDYTYNVKVFDYIAHNVELIAERQLEHGVSPSIMSNDCIIWGYGDCFQLKDGRLIEITEKDFASESEVYLSPYVRIKWGGNNRIGEVYEDEDYFYYDSSTSPYTYIGRVCRMPEPRLCSMGEISSEVLEDILLGKRKATAFDFYKIDDEVFFNDSPYRYYIGSDECYSSDFYKELLSHYGDDEKSDAIIRSDDVLNRDGSVLEGASFRTFLRELKKRPVSSIEKLVGFYVESFILENGMEKYSDAVLSKDSCAAAADSKEVYQQPSQSEIEDCIERLKKESERREDTDAYNDADDESWELEDSVNSDIDEPVAEESQFQVTEEIITSALKGALLREPSDYVDGTVEMNDVLSELEVTYVTVDMSRSDLANNVVECILDTPIDVYYYRITFQFSSEGKLLSLNGERLEDEL